MVAQGDAARYEMAAPAGRAALKAAIAEGAAPLPAHLLQDRIARPLGKTTFLPACSCVKSAVS
jgi:hypothetical protein